MRLGPPTPAWRRVVARLARDRKLLSRDQMAEDAVYEFPVVYREEEE